MPETCRRSAESEHQPCSKSLVSRSLDYLGPGVHETASSVGMLLNHRWYFGPARVGSVLAREARRLVRPVTTRPWVTSCSMYHDSGRLWWWWPPKDSIQRVW